MHTTYTIFLKRASGLFFLLLSACGSIESLTPIQTRGPSNLSATATVMPTALETFSLQETTEPAANVTPLPRPGEYIVYSKYNVLDAKDEIWAIDPHRQNPFLITVDMIPRTWSPSNSLWLFTLNGSIYVANADGSGVRAIYNNKDYTGVDPFWLTDNLVLFNAYKDIFSPPDIYSLDIGSGKITQFYPGENKFIQTTFPFEGTWLRGDWLTGSLDLVHQNGETEKFFSDFVILADYFNRHQIQLIDTLNKYLIAAKGQGDSIYKFWLVSNNETPAMLFDPGNEGVNFFMVSPDEQYLALTYVTSEGTFLNFLSLENQELAYQWPCPYKIGPCNFIWSPDSQSIVLPYSDSDLGTADGITSGIQVMNIATGATRIILNEDVTQILDWHFIE
jgi:hypothetical protein